MTMSDEENLEMENAMPTSNTPMLDLLAKNCVFGLDPNGNKNSVIIQEHCDGWFGVDFTLDELGQLADELKAIANGDIPCPDHDL